MQTQTKRLKFTPLNISRISGKQISYKFIPSNLYPSPMTLSLKRNNQIRCDIPRLGLTFETSAIASSIQLLSFKQHPSQCPIVTFLKKSSSLELWRATVTFKYSARTYLHQLSVQ